MLNLDVPDNLFSLKQDIFAKGAKLQIDDKLGKKKRKVYLQYLLSTRWTDGQLDRKTR